MSGTARLTLPARIRTNGSRLDRSFLRLDTNIALHSRYLQSMAAFQRSIEAKQPSYGFELIERSSADAALHARWRIDDPDKEAMIPSTRYMLWKSWVSLNRYQTESCYISCSADLYPCPYTKITSFRYRKDTTCLKERPPALHS